MLPKAVFPCVPRVQSGLAGLDYNRPRTQRPCNMEPQLMNMYVLFS